MDKKDYVEYEKIMIDNPSCHRRFHIAFEPAGHKVDKTTAKCSFCGVIVFEKENHPDVILIREENLIKSPDGSQPLIYNCKLEY